MKKSIVILINGLGIEKPGSYSISIDQCMPKLCRTKETSFFTTAITNSLEYKSAYQQFFLGDTSYKEIKYISDNVLGPNLEKNMIYQSISNTINNTSGKIHVFIDPTNEKVVDLINNLCTKLKIANDRNVYLHLLISSQTTAEYKKLINIVNYIKYNINSNITVGFIMGKEYLNGNSDKMINDNMKKMLFYCSCERWTNTEDKFNSLLSENVVPCKIPGFCATNSCNISNGDVILFFNTRRDNFDDYIDAIYNNASTVFKTDQYSLPIYSLIQLYSKYQINYLCENILYDNSFSNIVNKHNKKALILTSKEHLDLVNFDANGLQNINNPNIQFMIIDENLERKEVIESILERTDYEIIIFDYHMDVSRTIEHLKNQLEHIDIVIGHLSSLSENKHSLFITSLYGLKKTLPIADYNNELVTIDYESQIPIFLYDYTYPRSKYTLRPGETNDILSTALRCIIDDSSIDTLIMERGLKGIIGMFKG